ncbi:hypothetical protein L6164_013331 [Bauhinia variegata]|uniref:Uncharacterized protein n=1 Tax=Bauhinia variegata TaxID=167791 RepID=A0ACB9PI79_BAUVA|nr:hypothetical protein L6164_013331 [Bauhinia variegata]
MSNTDQNQHNVAYPSKDSTEAGSYPPVALPPPAVTLPTNEGYHKKVDPTCETTSKGDGFWRGCCAGLCCACCLDICF